jgi:hypothetical protein
MGALCLDFVVALAGFSWLELPAAHRVYINESYISPERALTVHFSDTSNWLV